MSGECRYRVSRSAGISPAAHSMRGGPLSSAAANGASIAKLKQLSRHRSTHVLVNSHPVDIFRDHVVKTKSIVAYAGARVRQSRSPVHRRSRRLRCPSRPLFTTGGVLRIAWLRSRCSPTSPQSPLPVRRRGSASGAWSCASRLTAVGHRYGDRDGERQAGHSGMAWKAMARDGLALAASARGSNRRPSRYRRRRRLPATGGRSCRRPRCRAIGDRDAGRGPCRPDRGGSPYGR
jgi:hypothetical protein